MEETRNCQNCKSDFHIVASDFEFYEKLKMPIPPICSVCRYKRRAQFRNEMSLYQGTCGKCRATIISMYHPDGPYVVYCKACWESDNWEPRGYARDYDKGRPFFDQLGELLIAVPKKALYITATVGSNINSDYTNTSGANKNCYLIFNSGLNEDSMYSRGLSKCREAIDMYFAVSVEHCYGGIDVHNSTSVVYADHVSNCFDSWFMRESVGCNDCFGCIGLRHKKYHFLNKEFTQEAYGRQIAAIKGSYSAVEEFRKKFEALSLTVPHRENHNLKTFDSTGNYLMSCKGVRDSFEAAECENCRDGFSIKYTKDSIGIIGYAYYSEQLIETVTCGTSNRVIGSYGVDNAQNVEYSFSCTNIKDSFGCDGLKNAQYCVFNNEYSPDEYKKIRDHIVAELNELGIYGQMMPPALSPFGYNETIANDDLPLSKEQAIKEGYKWQDDTQMTTGQETMSPGDIPDHIHDVPDSITEEILACVACNRNYRITKQELVFYKQMLIPLPRKCFYCRHAERIRARGPMSLFDRACDKCKKNIRTTYAPDRPEIVYCEKCYQSEVV